MASLFCQKDKFLSLSIWDFLRVQSNFKSVTFNLSTMTLFVLALVKTFQS